MNITEKVIIAVAILGVLALAGLALFVAIKAHLHHTGMAAELQNQKGKIVALEQRAVATVTNTVARVEAELPGRAAPKVEVQGNTALLSSTEKPAA